MEKEKFDSFKKTMKIVLIALPIAFGLLGLATLFLKPDDPSSLEEWMQKMEICFFAFFCLTGLVLGVQGYLCLSAFDEIRASKNEHPEATSEQHDQGF
ncbi:MAG: hypothetical protein HUJ60_04945 [Bacilli bacterium]|nr:hypothetical protein [Bacilli bacterium]